MGKNTSIDTFWKPFRNVIRNTDILDSLGVVRAFSVYREFGDKYPIPSDIQVDPTFYNDWRVLLPWDLETLAREILIISSNNSYPSKSLKKWHDLVSAVNKMKNIEDIIAKLYIGEKNIYKEVTVRLSNRQFRYQTDNPSNEAFVRYYHIYSHPIVSELITKSLGLNPLILTRIGAGLWANYLKYLGMYYPIEKLELSGITQNDYDKFMSVFSKELYELQKIMKNSVHRRLDDTFFYAFHELQTFPIIYTKMNGKNAHICPQPTLLFWRITTGIYYDMIGISGFDQAFGSSFEQYVGDVSKAIMKDSSVTIYGEEENSGPSRCDWIVDDTDSFLLVECKTKRLNLSAKTSLSSNDSINDQIGILAEAVLQAYKTLEAYRNKSYKNPKYHYDSQKQPYISIVTLEKWYLMGVQLRNLRDKVIELLDTNGFNGKKCVSDTPFIILSVSEYEEFIYIVKEKGLKQVVDPSIGEDKYNGWQFIAYLESRFKDVIAVYKYPFINEIDDIFAINNR